MGRRNDYVESFARTMLQKEQNINVERTRAVQLASEAVQQARQNRAMRRDLIYARMNGMQQVANMFAKHAQVQIQREQAITDRTKTLADIELSKAKMRLEDEAMDLHRDRLHMESALGVRRLMSDIMRNKSTEAYNRAISFQAGVRSISEMMERLPTLMDASLKAQAQAKESLATANAGVAAQFGMHYNPESKQFVAGAGSLAATIYNAGFADTNLTQEQFSGNMVGRLGETYTKRINKLRHERRQAEIKRTGNTAVPMPSIDSISANKRQQILQETIRDTMADYVAMGAIGAASGETRKKLMTMYTGLKDLASGGTISVEAAKGLGIKFTDDQVDDGQLSISLGQQQINELMLRIGSHATVDASGNIKGAVGTPSQRVNDYWNNSLITLSSAIGGTPEFFDNMVTEREKYASASEGIQAFGSAAVIGSSYIRNMLLNGNPFLNWNSNVAGSNLGLQTTETAQNTRDAVMNEVEETGKAMSQLLSIGEMPGVQGGTTGAVEEGGSGEATVESGSNTPAPAITDEMSMDALVNLMKTGPSINERAMMDAFGDARVKRAQELGKKNFFEGGRLRR